MQSVKFKDETPAFIPQKSIPEWNSLPRDLKDFYEETNRLINVCRTPSLSDLQIHTIKAAETLQRLYFETQSEYRELRPYSKETVAELEKILLLGLRHDIVSLRRSCHNFLLLSWKRTQAHEELIKKGEKYLTAVKKFVDEYEPYEDHSDRIMRIL